MAADNNAAGLAAKSEQQGRDMAESASQRTHEARMAVTPPPTDEDQQKQIDALIEAVDQMQKVLAEVAKVAMNGGAPKPPAPPPGPPPGPPPPPPAALPPMGPPPGPLPGAPPPGAPPFPGF